MSDHSFQQPPPPPFLRRQAATWGKQVTSLCTEWLDPVTGIVWEMEWMDLPRHVALRAIACHGREPAIREQ